MSLELKIGWGTFIVPRISRPSNWPRISLEILLDNVRSNERIHRSRIDDVRDNDYGDIYNGHSPLVARKKKRGKENREGFFSSAERIKSLLNSHREFYFYGV